MKRILLTILLFLTTLSWGQMPIVEEFNAGTTWTYTNGAGMQNYGGAENYATFNIGSTPYLNSSTITITSPVYDFSSICASDLTVSFPINGIIENGWSTDDDIVYFEYYNSGSWVTRATFTGNQASTPSYTNIPKTATQFRFRLVTDVSSLVWFKIDLTDGQLFMDVTHPTSVDYSNSWVYDPTGPVKGAIAVYYYDITRFTINCSLSLPIELISFTGEKKEKNNELFWITATEFNNDYFTVEKTLDGIDFEIVGIENGAGNSNQYLNYSMVDYNVRNIINYYRLKQTDFDGKYVYSDIISIDNRVEPKQTLKIINILGQEVDDSYIGVKIYYYTDGSFIRKM